MSAAGPGKASFAGAALAGAFTALFLACTDYGETGTPSTNTPRSDGGGGEDGSFAWAANDASKGGASDAGEDAATSSSGGPAPTVRSPGKIECGATQCTGGQRCCIEGSSNCGSSCSTLGETRCDEPADCADGQKCCTTEKYGYISGSVCTASCANYTVCFIDADCAGDKKCLTAPAPMPGPYKTCQ